MKPYQKKASIRSRSNEYLWIRRKILEFDFLFILLTAAMMDEEKNEIIELIKRPDVTEEEFFKDVGGQ